MQMNMQKNTPEIDVVIPVYRPDERLRRLLLLLKQQTVSPARILLVNTEEALFDPTVTDGIDGVEVIHIRKSEFDHGGTRHMAACRLQGAFLLFLTQDAVPADTHLIEELYRMIETPLPEKLAESLRKRAMEARLHTDQTEKEIQKCPHNKKKKMSGDRTEKSSESEEGRKNTFEDAGKICVTYACQLPAPDCGELERFTRSFNYGNENRIKTVDDLQELGIKTFFCSDVCAMYRRSSYEQLGGFVRRAIFNEDMIFASKVIRNFGAVGYCAQAKVIHSHNYSGRQQFHRNFDLGVSQAEHPEVFATVRSESEGIKMVKQSAVYFWKKGKGCLIPKLIWQSGCKYLGYRLGKKYQKLPMWLVKRCTVSPGYWEQGE